MGYDWRDFKERNGGEEGARAAFEKACESLIREMHPGAQQLRANPGDEGVDIYVGSIGYKPIVVYQCKFHLEDIGDSQKDQIRSSFKKAFASENFTMTKWTLCLPKVLDLPESKWWSRFKSNTEETTGVQVELLNGDQLLSGARRFGLFNSWFRVPTEFLVGNARVILRSQSPLPIRTELDVLKARNQSIPFVGRESTLASMLEWLDDDKQVSIRTLTGRAGAGKTRLAYELQRLVEESESAASWRSGFVWRIDLERVTIQGRVHAGIASSGKNLLMIVDYAATKVAVLRQWIEQLTHHSFVRDASKIRILLLERYADLESGWYHELSRCGFSDSEILSLFDPLVPIAIPAATGQQCHMIMQQTAKALLQHHINIEPIPHQDYYFRNDRRDGGPPDATWTPLQSMMAIVLAVTSDSTQLDAIYELSTQEMARALANRENNNLEQFEPKSSLLPLLAALTTIGGNQRYKDLLEAADFCRKQFPHRDFPVDPSNEQLCDFICTRFPTPSHGFCAGPVEPDLVGEAFVVDAFRRLRLTLKEQTAIFERALKQQPEDGAGQGSEAENTAMAFLRRILSDFDGELEHELALEWVDQIVNNGRSGDVDTLELLEAALPEHSLALREKALQITDQLYQRCEREHVIGNEASFADKHRRAKTLSMAQLSRSLGSRYAALGQHEEASIAAKEAVGLLLKLDDDTESVQQDLIRSLNLLAICLCETGNFEEARIAAEDAGQLANHISRASRSLSPSQGRSLATLGSILNAPQVLQQAVGILSGLTQGNEAFLPDTASALNDLGIAYFCHHEYEKASDSLHRAKKIYDDLLHANADAFLPDFPCILNNIGHVTLALDPCSFEAAKDAVEAFQQAVTLHRSLVAKFPKAFRGDLARSLYNLAGSLVECGKSQDSVGYLGEACRTILLPLRGYPRANAQFAKNCVSLYVSGAERNGIETDQSLVNEILEICDKARVARGQPWPLQFLRRSHCRV